MKWRHNGLDGVSNHQPHDCLLNRSFRRRSKKTSKLRVTGLCAGNSPVTGEFPTQMASNAENVSIWWRHYDSGSIVEAGPSSRGIILQDQPSGEVDIMLHPSRIRAFTCNVNHQTQLNCHGGMHSTNVCQEEERSDPHYVLRSTNVPSDRPCIITSAIWTKRSCISIW